MKVHDVYVSAIGVYLPDRVQSAEQAVSAGLYERESDAANDIRSVHLGDDVPAVEMGLRAAKRAMDAFAVDPADITMVIHTGTSRQGPENWGPASYLLRYTGVSESAVAFEVRHQCNGMFSSFHLAVAHLRAAPEHTAVLVVCSDNWATPPTNRWESVPGMVLGDGAAAVVLAKTPGFARLRSVDTLVIPELEELHRVGESLGPDFEPAASRGSLKDSSTLFVERSPHAADMHTLVDQANERLNERTVANSGIELSKMTRVGTMNASPALVHGRMLPLLGLPASRSTYDVGRDVGHVGGSDQTISLERLLRAGELGAGDHYLMAGVGPGLTCATAVLEIIEAPAALRTR
ncbi:ketoacyl-ACP synthase III family protein [Amycolatopsis sp. NPDC059090]|uniref:ketoacyl-ACP synthase III family protein n=1 Tax=unclassified Amycolatopsis TaxID=2618356 RepID=UPI00366F53D7